MKFLINGREVEEFNLSNEEIVSLIEDKEKLTAEQYDFLQEKVLQRFKYECCPHNSSENDDDVFVRGFSDFVNGKINSKRRVAELMSQEHRYLQSEMFKVCLEYIKKLAENCEKDWYDGRNEYACKTSKMIIDHFKEIDYPY